MYAQIYAYSVTSSSPDGPGGSAHFAGRRAFNSSVQLRTTEIDEDASPLSDPDAAAVLIIRKRFPSAVTSYVRPPSPANHGPSNSFTALPGLKVGVNCTGTAIIVPPVVM